MYGVFKFVFLRLISVFATLDTQHERLDTQSCYSRSNKSNVGTIYGAPVDDKYTDAE